ncbi:hypothetical protein KM043_005009 [Ampulex compressa]|nr:hypothetical protein KM043_005009 [Ampulex compressa]
MAEPTEEEGFTTEDTENTVTEVPRAEAPTDGAFDTDLESTDAEATDAQATGTEADETETVDSEAIDARVPMEVSGRDARIDEAEKRRDGEPAVYDEKSRRRIERRRKRGKGGRSWLEKCLEDNWSCEDLPPWRASMRFRAEDQRELEEADRFKRRKPADLPKFPRIKSEEGLTCPDKCFPLGAFQLRGQTELPTNLDRKKMIRIWRNMRANPPVEAGELEIRASARVSKTESGVWPGAWPCTRRDLVRELTEKQRKRRKRRRDVFPCDPRADEEETSLDKAKRDFSDRKELGHARIPTVCPKLTKESLVDRAAGERPGLVDGDYVVFELPSKTKGDRIYADVCLRGLKGMHLPELGPLRERKKTWKFCFYQAVVALLAKTQLRYKYAWSANIDYIYDHAWMLFTHIGTINVKDKQRLDDVVVYNYKYSVEVELVQEMTNVPMVEKVGWDYEERHVRRKSTLERKEPLKVQLKIGCEKITDRQTNPVHPSVRRIEEWFDELPLDRRNCVFRTERYCLAFWRDGLFWYLYNPYRCDEFGLWDDRGYACILKFCTKESLRRHLMILLLRAYSLPRPTISTAVEGAEPKEELTKPSSDNEGTKEDFLTLQIFHLIHHCCRVHNLRLLQRCAPSPRKRLVKAKTIDDCPFDPLDLRDPCSIEQEESGLAEKIERPTWLKLFEVTWAKCGQDSQARKSSKEAASKMRWHQYVVEESNKLFSLWGEVHVTDGMFEREHRGAQGYACYVVCAGMTRIVAPEYWTSKTLDAVVMCGDRYYAHSKLEARFKATKQEYGHVACWDRYLASHFEIGETMFEANVLPAICGRLYAKESGNLWRSLEQMFLRYHFGILTCESSCLGVFKFCGSYYMCDVNSFGPPLFPYGQGAAYLIRATYFYKFMRVLVLTIGSPECSRFALNPVEILKVVDVGKGGFPLGRAQAAGRKSTKVACPYDEEKKRRMKRWKHRRAEAERTIDKMCCKGND